MNELVKRGQGGVLSTRGSRAHAVRIRQIEEQVRETAREIDGLYALAAHSMSGAAELDQHRKATASNDETLAMLLWDVELVCNQLVKSKLRSHGSGFGI